MPRGGKISSHQLDPPDKKNSVPINLILQTRKVAEVVDVRLERDDARVTERVRDLRVVAESWLCRAEENVSADQLDPPE